MAIAASSWVDDFIDWLTPSSSCCRLYIRGPQKDEFCPSTESKFGATRRSLPVTAKGNQGRRKGRLSVPHQTHRVWAVEGLGIHTNMCPLEYYPFVCRTRWLWAAGCGVGSRAMTLHMEVQVWEIPFLDQPWGLRGTQLGMAVVNPSELGTLG